MCVCVRVRVCDEVAQPIKWSVSVCEPVLLCIFTFKFETFKNIKLFFFYYFAFSYFLFRLFCCQTIVVVKIAYIKILLTHLLKPLLLSILIRYKAGNRKKIQKKTQKRQHSRKIVINNSLAAH